MDAKHLKRLIKICRDNGIKEIENEGLKIVFNETMTAEKLSPNLKKPKNAKSPQDNSDELKSKPQAQSYDEDLILSDPYAWEVMQIAGGNNVN